MPWHLSGQSAVATDIPPHMAEAMERVLVASRLHLGMDLAFITEFLGKDRIFQGVSSAEASPLRPGTVMPLAVGYCAHVIAGRLPELIPDTALVPLCQALPETKSFPIGAHLSVPIRLRDGRVFGTFCCLSHTPKPSLNAQDLELMRTFASLTASGLDSHVLSVHKRDAQARELQAAVEAGDPRIVFQPIVRTSDLSIVGVEALSRFWTEPRRGPDVWFEAASIIGWGTDLELLAVRKALQAASKLPDHLSVSVNLSPDTLTSADATDALAGFDPRRIVIELTEHVPISDYGPIIRALHPLRKRGIRIAIDDAGAGHSSLRHVLALKPDIIKLDTSMIRAINGDRMRKAMVMALAEFAQQTRIRVVAEGVETQAEFETLRKLNITHAQGYYFAVPQDAQHLQMSLAQKLRRGAPS
ncbi:sensor domain-containing phosphodiesterase [Jiella pacifica]|uniref:EAL domain-containing protein n=1 Tax=Jiella pacifica TaxID=2696469 RepID=A0A6N9TC93_9HYPH|nr:EAL domain-containing protein [Jiella pacifica]NDW07696.1 EAL domain-containing protein [Jiella pacifica]